MIEITTNRHAIRHTMARVGLAVSVTLFLTLLMIVSQFGVDPDATVRVGLVMTTGIITGVVIAGLLTGSLTYRSALMMQELNLARAELLRISRADQLTGLYNRRAFDETATSILATAKSAKANAIAFMCDIDHFKAINDQFGHEFGDKVIVRIAGVFKTFAEQNGALVARHGGEEFRGPDGRRIGRAGYETRQRIASSLRVHQDIRRRNDGLCDYQHRPYGVPKHHRAVADHALCRQGSLRSKA